MNIARITAVSILVLLSGSLYAFDLGSLVEKTLNKKTERVVKQATERVVDEGVDNTTGLIKEAFPSLSDGKVSAETDPSALPNQGVVLYETDSCPYCIKARQYLNSNQVAYVSRNVGNSGTAKQEFKRLGGRGVPMILVNDKRLTGWNQGKLRRLLAEAGYL